MNLPSPTDRSMLASCTLVATIATVSSLYFSEVLGLYPCDLCWVQRIAMYPLVVVLAVGTYENRPGVWRTVLPLSVAGAVVAAYHSYLQLTPTATCSVGGGCERIQYELFGLFSIPNLALIAFCMISVVIALSAFRPRP